MKALTEIRIGLCGCMDLYNGALEGRQFRFSRAQFVLREVRLPDEVFHTRALKAARCHFFIDYGSDHPLDTYVLLSREDLVVSPSGRSERLVSRSWSAMAWDDEVWQDNQWVSFGKSLSARGMLRLIRQRIFLMDSAERSAWLQRMSLRGQTAVD